jgi:hypothetical protein
MGNLLARSRPTAYIRISSSLNIFIDESGSFVSAPKKDSWNCIAAYLTPEMDRKYVRAALANLKRAAGISATKEIKLRNLHENDYFDFLICLSKLNGVLFAVATDAGLNRPEDVFKHQKDQSIKITEHKDKMYYESGREGLQTLSDKLTKISPQLYVQLQCQINLLSTIVLNGVLYFVQRYPKTLGKFRWRIDQKNSTRTEYEKAFETLAPPLLQTISLTNPLLMLEGADYSAFQRFDYPEEERPTYLKDIYGIDLRGRSPALNIGKLLHEDLKFEDSKENQGVQVADLLAAGIRRCLRNEFSNSRRAAQLLGRLMVQGADGRSPIMLLSFTEAKERASFETATLIRIMERHSRAMLAPNRRDMPI